MRIGTPLKHDTRDGPFDAIVVGSGIGGLATAAILAREAGRRVLVLERHYTAGGFTHVFHRPGFEWDVGVHYVGDVHRPGSALRRLFDYLSRGRLAWAPMDDVYDRVIIGERHYDFVAGHEAFRARMQAYFPAETGGIDAYLDATRRCARASGAYFTEKAMPGPIAFLAGGVIRHGFMKYAAQTTLEVVQGCTRNAELAGVLTAQYGDYGLPPGESSFGMHAIVAAHYLEGAAYPAGGSSAIAASVLPTIEEAGGAVLVDAEVDDILIDAGAAVGVRITGGREFRAPVVVSDAGVATTFERLVPDGTPGRSAYLDLVSRIGPSAGHVCLYVGLDGSASELRLSTTNLWIHPSADHDANVAAYLADDRAPLPMVYISFPSAKDPDFARRYPGRSTVEVLTLAPYGRFVTWAEERWRRRGDDYEQVKARMTDRLLEHLYAHVPQARGRVLHAELSTPLSTRHFANYGRGEIYGLNHTPARFAERMLKPATPIKGLFLTGQDICTAGVGGAAFGGVITASAVLHRNVLNTILEKDPA